MNQTSASALKQTTPAKAIFITWLIVGTLDLSTAIIVSGATPENVLRYIASGAFGPEAFQGGTFMMFNGLLFHYFIAFFWTLLFFLLYPRIGFLRSNKYVVGLLYGIFVWACMNLLVVPLSNIPYRPLQLKSILINSAILMVMIGLPISLMANRFYNRASPRS